MNGLVLFLESLVSGFSNKFITILQIRYFFGFPDHFRLGKKSVSIKGFTKVGQSSQLIRTNIPSTKKEESVP